MANPPSKPPRGVKTQKETSGLLMTMIRALSATESNEHREIEKTALEREYKRCDQKLEELISMEHQNLARVMQLFTSVSSAINISREKVQAAKQKLVACKSLLRCRRDELRKFYVESIEQHHMLTLLSQIEQIKEVPSQLNMLDTKNQYIQCTKLLMETLKISNNDLKNIDALNELRKELSFKKQTFYNKLLDELINHIYVISPQAAKPFRRIGSDGHNSSFGQNTRRSFKYNMATVTTKDILNETNDNEIVEFDTETFIPIAVECFALLLKLNDAIEKLKSTMQTQLVEIVEKTTKQLSMINHTKNSKDQLVALINGVILQFYSVVDAHQLFLTSLEKVDQKLLLNVNKYDLKYVWESIESIVQMFLSNYLDVNSHSDLVVTSAPIFSNIDLNVFFSKRKPQRPKQSLFKFSNALECSTDILDRPFTSLSQPQSMICTPSSDNIVHIYEPLTMFIQQIEQSVNTDSCSLSLWLNEYIRTVFLDRQHSKVATTIESITKQADAWHQITTPEQMQELHSKKPLLSSTVNVWDNICEIKKLVITMPEYASHFLMVMVSVSRSYKETCDSLFTSIVKSNDNTTKLVSNLWIQKNDLVNYLKESHNWVRKDIENKVKKSSIEELKRFSLEADILFGNLEGNDFKVSGVSDINQLRCLAHLSESMEWFSKRLNEISGPDSSQYLVPKIKSPNTDNNNLPLSLIETLQQLSNDYLDISDNILLYLFLEIRAQCIFYLLPSFESAVGNSAEPKVLDLNQSISALHEAMLNAMSSRKTKYIFEGLGEVMAKGLVNQTRNIETVDEVIIRKMVRDVTMLKYNLAAMLGASQGVLEKTVRYYELLLCTPKDILEEILEKGAIFSELEYMNLLQIVHRSKNNFEDKNNLQSDLQRLSDILSQTKHIHL
ncbi:exocyst complex component 4 [Adelges cooleyi]|uniref:exocyst complex component 4 n=1 Tax=Adelges cooleyi TaxID=133065 RepID=UPI00217F831A|nr:exocyst complex component 4 [Adelges cooleyi]